MMYAIYIMHGDNRSASRDLDDAAWSEELAFIKERAKSLPEGGPTRRWRREASYDFRRMRLPEPTEETR
jgi:hypothetical protein